MKWIAVTKCGVTAYNDKFVQGVKSFEACAELCESWTGGSCKSFDWNEYTYKCFISRHDQHNADGGLDDYWVDYTYGELCDGMGTST